MFAAEEGGSTLTTLIPTLPASSSAAMSQGTLPSTSVDLFKSEAIRGLLVFLTPTLTLLASMSTVAGVSGISFPSAEPLMTENIVSVDEPPRVYVPVVASPATTTVQAMAQAQFDQFNQNLRFAATLLINSHRPFSFVQPILEHHVTNINLFMGVEWGTA